MQGTGLKPTTLIGTVGKNKASDTRSKITLTKFRLSASLMRWVNFLGKPWRYGKCSYLCSVHKGVQQRPYLIRHHPNDVFSFTHNLTEGCNCASGHNSRRIVLYMLLNFIMNKRTHSVEVRATIRMVFPVLVRVRAYWRFRYGKWEHVRAHYRRYWGIF